MGIFRQHKPRNDAPPADPLAAALASDREPAFSLALEEADSLSQRGVFEGILAIREAIRIRSGREDVRFDMPKNLPGEPEYHIRILAKKRALLKDPGASCGHLTNFLSMQRFVPTLGRVPTGHITNPAYWDEGAVLNGLWKAAVRAGGPRAGCELRLLCYEMGSRMKLMDSCRRTGRWEEFFRLGNWSREE